MRKPQYGSRERRIELLAGGLGAAARRCASNAETCEASADDLDEVATWLRRMRVQLRLQRRAEVSA